MMEEVPANVAKKSANDMEGAMDKFEKQVIEKESRNYREKLRSTKRE